MSIERAEIDLERARSDVARLTMQLRAAESRVVKLENYIEMARAYNGREAPSPRHNGSAIVRATIDIIRERESRQQTRILVEELERRGFQIGGSNKITNLSGALSRSPLLSASRTAGWGLKEWEKDEKPPGLSSATTQTAEEIFEEAFDKDTVLEEEVPF